MMFLQKDEAVGSGALDQMVRIRPIMSGGDLSVSSHKNNDRTI